MCFFDGVGGGGIKKTDSGSRREVDSTPVGDCNPCDGCHCADANHCVGDFLLEKQETSASNVIPSIDETVY